VCTKVTMKFLCAYFSLFFWFESNNLPNCQSLKNEQRATGENGERKKKRKEKFSSFFVDDDDDDFDKKKRSLLPFREKKRREESSLA